MDLLLQWSELLLPRKLFPYDNFKVPAWKEDKTIPKTVIWLPLSQDLKKLDTSSCHGRIIDLTVERNVSKGVGRRNVMFFYWNVFRATNCNVLDRNGCRNAVSFRIRSLHWRLCPTMCCLFSKKSVRIKSPLQVDTFLNRSVAQKNTLQSRCFPIIVQ